LKSFNYVFVFWPGDWFRSFFGGPWVPLSFFQGGDFSEWGIGGGGGGNSLGGTSLPSTGGGPLVGFKPSHRQVPPRRTGGGGRGRHADWLDRGAKGGPRGGGAGGGGSDIFGERAAKNFGGGAPPADFSNGGWGGGRWGIFPGGGAEAQHPQLGGGGASRVNVGVGLVSGTGAPVFCGFFKKKTNPPQFRGGPPVSGAGPRGPALRQGAPHLMEGGGLGGSFFRGRALIPGGARSKKKTPPAPPPGWGPMVFSIVVTDKSGGNYPKTRVGKKKKGPARLSPPFGSPNHGGRHWAAFRISQGGGGGGVGGEQEGVRVGEKGFCARGSGPSGHFPQRKIKGGAKGWGGPRGAIVFSGRTNNPPIFCASF